jgi:hypothetical protein
MLVSVGIEGTFPMRRLVTCLLLAACCLAASRGAYAQSPGDSLANPWTLASPEASRSVPAGQEGRTELMSMGCFMGIALYGWSIPALTPHGDVQQTFRMYVAGTVASSMLPWLASTRWPVTPGVAAMAGNGAVRGALHGALLYVAGNGEGGVPGDPFGFPRNGDVHFSDIDTPEADRRLLRYALATSLAEASLGYACARTFRLSEDDAATIATFGDFGMIVGDAGAQWSVIPPRRIPGYYWDEQRETFVRGARTSARARRRIAFATLAGGVTGQAAGAILASRRHYSAGGASVMRAAGLLGLWAGYGVAYGPIHNPAARRRRCAGMITGGVAGLVVGDRLAAGRPIPAGRGALVQGAALAGGALGLGLPYLYGAKPATGTVLATSVGGAVAGFAVSYRALARHAPARARDAGAWRVQLEPGGLLALSGLVPAAAQGTSAPLVTLRCRLP